MNDIAPPIIISITTIFAKTIGSKQKQKRSNAIKAYGQNYCKTEYYCHKFMSNQYIFVENRFRLTKLQN